MHDPMTVVYRNNIFTIWHVDPMTDGTDNSCGWTFSKLTKKENEILKKDLDYNRSSIIKTVKEWKNGNELRVVYSVYHTIKWKFYKKHLNTKDYLYILDLCLNPYDDLTIYDDGNDEQEFDLFYWNLARLVKTKYRKWWNHPKYHFWHWSIKINKYYLERRGGNPK